MSENRDQAKSDPEVIFQQAFGLLDAGRLEEAIALFDRVSALVPGAAAPHVGRGDALQALRRFDAAVKSYDRAIALEPVSEIYINRGVALQGLGKFEAAVASYDRATALNPAAIQAWSNRGNALRSLDRHEVALESYDRAIMLGPNFAEAYANRAGALEELDRRSEATASYEKAVSLAPGFLDAKQRLLANYMHDPCNAVRIESLVVDVAKAVAQASATDVRREKTISDFRALHDLEQADYLARTGCAFAGLSEVRAKLAEIQSDLSTVTTGARLPLRAVDIEVLARFREQVFRYPAKALPGACLNPSNNWAGIEDRYFNSAPEIVVIDNLLSAEALMELHKFCLASTIWRQEYNNQYLGAFSEGGFVSPLHLQIATELQRTMPRIFGGQRLEQLWGFKYTSYMGRGINVHADFAKVNLNFWITPDEANLDPNSGGMIVYDVPAPASWSYAEYNNTNSDGIMSFLKEHKAGSHTVPYRCNRAVLFNSNLFHETDAIRFKDGYENRRINVTYLFGKRFKR
jgi:tetratricopeptide (TPR) repeat protein